MVLYIALGNLVIACIEGTGVCMQIPEINLARLALVATVELIFEVAGFVKIYRSRSQP